MLGVNRKTNTEPLFRELGLQNADQIHWYTSETFVYRWLSNPNMFAFQSLDWNTRDSGFNLFDVLILTSAHCTQGITFRGPTIYNSIPQNLL